MPKIQIHIKYTQRDGVYFAGDKLAGILNIVNNDISHSNVIVIIDGRAQTNWVNKNSDKIYESNEQWLRHVIELTPVNLNSSEAMTRGQTYSFEFTLPENLPSSYDGLFGQISYCTIAEIFNKEGEVQTTSEKGFIVISKVDLCRIPKTVRPVEAVDTAEFSYCSCVPFGVVQTVVTISKNGYLPNEPIHVNAVVYNATRRKLKNAKLILIQRSTFNAKSRYESATDTKETFQKVCELNKGSVYPHQCLKITNEALIVPTVIPTFETGIISISYTLRLAAYPEIEVDIPITIGSETVTGNKNSLKIYQKV